MATHKLICLALAVLPYVASAQQGGGIHYLDEMSSMDIQVNLLKKKKELNDLMKQSGGPSVRLPQIVFVAGPEDQMMADVIYDNGLRRKMKKGESVSKGVEIVEISPTSVVVEVPMGKAGKVKHELEFTVRPVSMRQVAPSAVPALPAVPNLPPVSMSAFPQAMGAQAGQGGAPIPPSGARR